MAINDTGQIGLVPVKLGLAEVDKIERSLIHNKNMMDEGVVTGYVDLARTMLIRMTSN